MMRLVFILLSFINLCFALTDNFTAPDNEDLTPLPLEKPNYISEAQQSLLANTKASNKPFAMELTETYFLKMQISLDSQTKVGLFYKEPYWFLAGNWKHPIIIPSLKHLKTIQSIEQLNPSVLKIKLASTLYPRVYREDNKWSIFWETKKTEPVHMTSSISPNSETILFSLKNSSSPITFQHDLQTYWVFPTDELMGNISLNKDFVPFSVLESPQGVVIQPRSNLVSFDVKNSSVALSFPTAFQSRNLLSHRISAYVPPLFYPIPDWEKRYRHLSELYRNTPLNQCSAVPFQVAWLLLYAGEGLEGQSLLDMRKDACPDIQQDDRYHLLADFGLLLAEHLPENERLFRTQDPNYRDDPEVILWQHMQEISRGIFTPEILDDKALLSYYPNDLKQNFGLKIVKKSFEINDLDAARLFLDPVIITNLETQSDWEAYLHARELIGKNQKKAMEILKHLTDKTQDLYLQTLAHFDFLNISYQNRTINFQKYVHELRSLKLDWKQSNLQRTIVQTIVDTAVAENKVPIALKELQFLEQEITEKSKKDLIRQRMSDLLYNYLNQKSPTNILEFIATYTTYKDYLPKTLEVMDKLLSHLYQTLIKLGLLKQAINLLSDFVKNYPAASPEWREKLSELYILDAQADDALAVIKDLPDNEAVQLLRGKALMLKGNAKAALQVIEPYNGYHPLKLKRRIFFKLRKWDDLENVALKLLDMPEVQGIQRERLYLDIAIAYEQQGQNLAPLRKKYLHLFKDPILRDEFDLLTDSSIPKPKNTTPYELKKFLESFNTKLKKFQNVTKNTP